MSGKAHCCLPTACGTWKMVIGERCECGDEAMRANGRPKQIAMRAKNTQSHERHIKNIILRIIIIPRRSSPGLVSSSGARTTAKRKTERSSYDCPSKMTASVRSSNHRHSLRSRAHGRPEDTRKYATKRPCLSLSPTHDSPTATDYRLQRARVPSSARRSRAALTVSSNVRY